MSPCSRSWSVSSARAMRGRRGVRRHVLGHRRSAAALRHALLQVSRGLWAFAKLSLTSAIMLCLGQLLSRRSRHPGSPLPPLGLEPVARRSKSPTPVGAAGRTGGGGASSWTSWSTPAPAGSAPEAAGRRPSSSRGASRRRAAAAGTAAREGAALLLFYAVALAEASLFLFEKAYWTWKVSVRKLLHQVSPECKLGAYGLVSLTRSVSPASTRLDLAPRLCYALRRWPGSDARPRHSATCTTAALPASCRARTTAVSPPRAAPHVAAAPRRYAWLRQPRRAPPAAVGSRRRPRLRPAAVAPRHAHELAAAVALVKLRRPWSGPTAARSSAGCYRAPAAAGTARITTPRPQCAP